MSGPQTTRRLNIETLRALPIGEEVWDHVVDGLHVRRKASGIRWHVYYRDGRGDRRRPTIGQYPALGIEPARAAAKALLQAVARGEDPSAERRAARAAPRVSDMIARYLAEDTATLKPRTLKLYRQCLEVIGRRIGTVRADDVTPADVERALAGFGGPYAANNGRRVLRRVWSVAASRWRWTLPANPVAGTTPSPHRNRRRRASPEELNALVAALDGMRTEYPAHVAMILCLAFTGARVGELVSARRSHVETRGGKRRIVLADHKTMRTGAERVIELPDQAWQEISRLPTRPDGLIFGPGYDAVDALWSKAKRAAGVTDLRLHDLRRTFASHGKSGGQSLDATGDILGHESTETTRGYAYLFEDERAKGAQAIADSVGKAMRAKPTA